MAHDLFKPGTYLSPASIISMTDLRELCADYFEQHVRPNVATDDENLHNFIALITSSDTVFARARAVIPELQVPRQEEDEMRPHENIKLQMILDATNELRGPPEKTWDALPEDVVWRKHLKRNEEKSEVKKKAQEMPQKTSSPMQGDKSEDAPTKTPPVLKLETMSIAEFIPGGGKDMVWSPTSGSRPRQEADAFQPPAMQSTTSMQTLAEVARWTLDAEKQTTPPIRSGHTPSVPTLHAPLAPIDPLSYPRDPTCEDPHYGAYRRLPRKREPGSIKELWKPQLGDAYQSGPTSYARTPFDPSSGSGRDTASPHRQLPPLDARSPQPMPPIQHAIPAYGENVDTQYAHSSNPTNKISVKPFSAPPSIPGFGGLHNTGQGMHGGPASPAFQQEHFDLRHQTPRRRISPWDTARGNDSDMYLQMQMQLSGAGISGAPRSIPTEARVPATIGAGRERASGQTPMEMQMHRDVGPMEAARGQMLTRMHMHGGIGPRNDSPGQMPMQEGTAAGGPDPQDYLPFLQHPYSHPYPEQLQTQTQFGHPFTDPQLVFPPPQGSMDPLNYWNMLYHKEGEILSRMQHSNGLTASQAQYINMLREVRIETAMSQLPVRQPGMGKRPWLRVLEKTMSDIWIEREGQAPRTAEVVARKADFEKAVGRAIEIERADLMAHSRGRGRGR